MGNSKKPPIVLLTDFGNQDPFVGIMKGVIENINPGTTCIDLTHEIPPGDIQRAAIILWQSIPYFPKGTIFLVVVDPGVGTKRQPIMLKSKGHTFIGPDNGLFTFIIKPDAEAWELSNPVYQLPNPGTTFHGRDIFAPAAAYAAGGIEGGEFGNPLGKPLLLTQPLLESPSPGQLWGEILYADQFGNVLTSLGIFERMDKGVFTFIPWVGNQPSLVINLDEAELILQNKGKIRWVRTFAEIPRNEYAFIVGSSGLIEVASNRVNAARLLNLIPGDTVELHFPIT